MKCAMIFLYGWLIARLCFTRRATAGGQLQYLHRQHLIAPRQRDDIANMHRKTAFFNSDAIDADMTGLGPCLRQRSAFGEPQEKQQFVDTEAWSGHVELEL